MPDSHTSAGDSKSSSNDPPLTSSAGFPPENKDGTPGLIGPDDFTRQLMLARANKVGGTAVVGGNYADLQRMGEVAATGDKNPAFQAGPGVDLSSDRYVTAAQAEAARGEWTRETERTGLLTEPPAPEPKENKSADPVDPTSTSPTTRASGSSTPSTATSPKK